MLRLASERKNKKATHCASNDTAQRIPGRVVEPVEKVVKIIFNKLSSGAIIKPEKRRNSSHKVEHEYRT